MSIDLDGRRCAIAGEWFAEGDLLTLDGHAGEVLAGAVSVEIESPVELLERVAQHSGMAVAAIAGVSPEACAA